MDTGSPEDVPGSGVADDRPDPVPVVLLGASAGGLDAFTKFLDALPADLGAACVFLMHMDPRRSSNLPELPRSHTELPIVEAEDGAELLPNHCYVPIADFLARGRDPDVEHDEESRPTRISCR